VKAKVGTEEHAPDLDELREVVTALAAEPRPSASEAERRAAEWIGARLEEQGCTVAVEQEIAYGGFWWPVAAYSALGAVSGLLALKGRRASSAGPSPRSESPTRRPPGRTSSGAS
jgi:hypothetical protein